MHGIMEQTQAKSTIQPKRIVLGLTGGIAAYKAAELARLLAKQGIAVQVAMTEAACHFITPATMQALTGRPVLVNQWDATANGMAHIDTSRAADAIVIAPATADFIAKLAHGLADDLLSTLCLARDCPLLVAPAMNQQMWANAATQRNIAQLERDGVTLLGPASGAQACGEEGMGRMLEAEALAADIAVFLRSGNTLKARSASQALTQDLPAGGAPVSATPRSAPYAARGEREPGQQMDGMKVLITAGPTYEPIDTVRGITNRSSGKMGYAVAQAALELGAEVTLVSGPVALPPPTGVQVVNVTSALEMFDAVKARAAQTDVFIGVAAVADYRPLLTSDEKIKKGDCNLLLELTPNPDILAYVASLPQPPFCVGFAAESENLREFATAKRLAKHVPLLAANLAQRAIGSNDNELVLFDDEGEHVLPRADKQVLARQLMQHVLALYKQGVKK
jgi:phosphopantothenoylcysteine decarboxylase/phosphopantothenate--cysteine ligase